MMASYSIRRLFLDHEPDLQAELKGERGLRAEEFARRVRRYPWVLKVICREQEFSKNLLSAFSLRDIPCWLAAPGLAYLFTDEEQLRQLALGRQLFASNEAAFARELRVFLENQTRTEFVIDSPKCSMIVGGPTLVMGVLNCTPDSFYDGGRYHGHEHAIAHGLQMAEAGADLIDIGGESTRPKGVYGEGAEPVSAEEEMARVLPVIEALSQKAEIPLSIDTYKAAVAEAALQAGAAIVNDISGFLFDPHMAEVVAQHQAVVILMHLKGTPANMQSDPTYENLLDEIYLHLEARVEAAMQAGIPHERILIDPGIGFGKRLEHNFEILRRLEELHGLGCPILVGPSRKSFVGSVLNLPPDQRLEGTAAAVALAVNNGAHLVRVHDVEEMRRVAHIADLIAGRFGYTA
ncbi:dihydropteroate synthase [bacterium]|nr:dihydropteroate synthase [bacterium]